MPLFFRDQFFLLKETIIMPGQKVNRQYNEFMQRMKKKNSKRETNDDSDAQNALEWCWNIF